MRILATSMSLTHNNLHYRTHGPYRSQKCRASQESAEMLPENCESTGGTEWPG